MALQGYFFSSEPSQSLGLTKLFTSYKPKIIDTMMYICHIFSSPEP